MQFKSANSRHKRILEDLQTQHEVNVSALSKLFEVSEITVRKDLAQLESRGLLVRTHGGAIQAEDTPAVIGFNAKSSQFQSEKEEIAAKAADLVRDGMNIMLDAGTTCLALARRLKAFNLQVTTNSLTAAMVLSTSEAVQLIVLGGSYRAVTAAIIGQSAVDQISRYNFDIAFVGASGATAGGGFSCQNLHEANIKRQMLEQAERRVIVMDSSKFGTNKFAAFAPYEGVHTLVTDGRIDPEQRQRLTDRGIEVI